VREVLNWTKSTLGGRTESQPTWRDQRRQVVRLKHRSFHMEEAYIGWVKRFLPLHDKRHPKNRGAAESRAFLASLATHPRRMCR
jgi:hypothetical protein